MFSLSPVRSFIELHRSAGQSRLASPAAGVIGIMLITLLQIAPAIEAAPPLSLNTASKTAVAATNLSQPEIDPVALKSDIENKLDIAKQKLTAMEPDMPVRNPALLAGKDAINPRRIYLKQLVNIYQAQLARLSNLQLQRESRIKLENQTKNWSGFKEQPPYPFLLADNLSDSVSKLNRNKDELEEMLGITRQAEVLMLNTLEASSIKLRQAEEALEQAKNSEQQVGLRRRHEQLEAENQLDMAQVIGLQIETNLKNEAVLEIKAKLQLANKQIGLLLDKLELTEHDVNQARAEIDIEKQRIHAEIDQTLAAREAIQQQNSALGHSVMSEPERAQLQQRRSTQLSNNDIKLQVLNRILNHLDVQREIWGQRWAFSQVADRKKADEAYALISKKQAVLKTHYQYIYLHRRLVMTKLTDQINQDVTLQAPGSGGVDHGPDSLDFDSVISYSRLLRVIEATENLLTRAQADLDKKFAVKSLRDSLEETRLTIAGFLADVWAFELFAVEDILVVDGQQLASQRSVTVSKVVTALAILIIGYWIAARLARIVEGLAVSRFDIDPSLARIARRWIFFTEVLLLIVISMLVVRIPLTVFAFMGGAVAIGAGFGMQNLLKNLISGLMLLMERPFRPGDLVEVGGIRGRITDIGVRSSQILDANGIETLIPNSTFIEQNVTNWTLSDQIVRIAVNVGAAYGSSTKDISRLLLDAADRHGLVLEEPAPQVLFEDFGNDALLFGLYVWVRLQRDVSWKAIASDLRFMINKSFNEHGIVIAFPQRDIHLDTSRPLEIRMVSNASARTTAVASEAAPDRGPHLP